MLTAVVTGATGFIGRHVVGRLAGRYCVMPLSESGDTGHPADLLDSAQIDRALAACQPDILVHLAWLRHCPDYLHAPEHALWCDASVHLLEAFRRIGGRRVLLAGSSYELHMPDTAYARAKRALRDRALAMSGEGPWSPTWCRVFGTFGPDDRPHKFIPTAIERLLLGRDMVLRNGDALWDYLHVDDVAGALDYLLGNGIEGDVDINSGRSARLADLYAALRLMSHSPPEFPGCISTVPTQATPGARPITALGWKPSVELLDGLQRTVALHVEKAS